ncbi:hypothetical protein E2C01_024132 [Portunus trituberculatus]|uniref:Uncharacterized protein n=1 Tax=Portunus trituberculatus TaxID=210409 RepID=A0A5B7E9R5_PORTR|nr:hypothetical protein [Portunus trituberculatus]
MVSTLQRLLHEACVLSQEVFKDMVTTHLLTPSVPGRYFIFILVTTVW